MVLPDIFTEDDWDSYRGPKASKSPYYPDLHLKTAIRKYNRENFIKHLKNHDYPVDPDTKKSVEQFKLTGPNRPTRLLSGSEKLYSRLLRPTLIRHRGTSQLDREYGENNQIARDITLLATSHYMRDILREDQLRKLKKDINQLTLPEILKPWILLRDNWEIIRDIMKDRQIAADYKFKTLEMKSMSGSYQANAYFLIVTLDGEDVYLLDYSQVLMISDTIASRYLSLLYSWCQSIMKLNNVPKIYELLSLYKWGDDILAEKGNEGYDTIKQLEPIAISVFLKKWEPLQIGQEFYNQLIANESDQYLINKMRELFQLLFDSSPHYNHIVEFFGCYRHFGHPTVDEQAGVDSLKENSRLDIPIDKKIAAQVTGAFNRMFILEFLKKQKRWPKCTLSDQCTNPSFQKLVFDRSTTFSEYDLRLPLEEWSYILFEQEFQFDDFPDFTLLLSDKALSPYLENWTAVYCKDILNIQPPQNMEESRRVLLEVLSRDVLSCKEIRETIQSGVVPNRWKIIGVHSKEREMKIKSRLFAMMCLEMRLYFNMTEKNIAEKIFPYVPYQTMTWTDAELTKVMLNLSYLQIKRYKGRNKSKKGCVYVTISLDFNKFNQKWRYESTCGIFQSIDRLFGTPGLLDFSHIFFQQAYFYLSSNLYPPPCFRASKSTDTKHPNPPDPLFFESETTWGGQPGGCEGLRQKGWTAIIVAALVANAFLTGIHSTIIGQGDNQIIVAEFEIPYENMSAEEYIKKHSKHLNDRIKEYLRSLQHITSGIGMDLKIQESWVSTRLFNYGKEILVDGCFLSNAFKKISRTYSDVSELYPSLQNRVAAMFTSAQATAMKSYDVIVPYFIATFDVLNMLSKESIYGTTMRSELRKLLKKNKLLLDRDLKMMMLLLPRECGGLPVIPLFNIAFRGHSDNMTGTLVWLKCLAQDCVVARHVLDLITSGYFISRTPDPLQLIQDPQSMNFTRPIQSSNKVKRMLDEALRTENKNQHISLMMDNCNNDTLRDMAGYLSTVRPFNPRVLNEILRLSPDGSMLSFLSIFKDMRTMKGMLKQEGAKELVRSLQQSDIDLVAWVIHIHKITIKDSYLTLFRETQGIQDLQAWMNYHQDCTTEQAQKLRCLCWELPIEGVTTPHPQEQTQLFRAQGDMCDYTGCTGSEMIIYVVNKIQEDLIQELGHQYCRGPTRPFLGAGTSEKRSGAVIIYTKSEKALRAAQQLTRVQNWVVDHDNPGNTLATFLNDLIASRCDATQDFLVLTAGANYGGSIQHRFSDVTTKHESRPGIRVNTHSWVLINSDELGKYARGKENYPLVFQSLYLWALSKINHLLILDPTCTRSGNIVFHQHLVCQKCLPLIKEENMKTEAIPPSVPIIRDCPLIYTTIDENLGSIPISSIENTETISPSPQSPDLSQKMCYATALVILGSVESVMNPIIHTSMKITHTEGTLVSLTVGLFMKLDLKTFFQSLAQLWLLDNMPQILLLQKDYDSTLIDAAEMLMEKYPDKVWDLLKPYLCVKEVQLVLRRQLRMFTTSSETYITGAGLGYAINHLLIRLLKKMHLDSPNIKTRKKMYIPFLSTAPGISINRMIFLWTNSVIFNADWRDIKQLAAGIKLGSICIRESIQGEGVDLSKLSILLGNQELAGMSLLHSLTHNRIKLSKVGIEPWLAPSLLPEPMIVLPTQSHRLDDLTINQLRRKIVTTYHLFDMVHSVPLQPYSDTDLLEDLPVSIQYPERIPHLRDDHTYRLVGKYSTAALKYLHIMVHNGIERLEASVHLAEGAGGLSRAAAVVLGSKCIIYNSLLEVSAEMAHRMYHFRPAELEDLDNIEVIGPTYCYQTGGDITNEETIRRYQEAIKLHSLDIGVLTCDAEFPTEGTVDMARSLLTSFIHISRHAQPGTLLIFKTFCRLPGLLSHQVSIWCQNVDSPKIEVPTFSSYESSEVFLVGRVKSHWRMKTDVRKISRWNQNNVSALSDIRVAKRPFAEDHDQDILKSLYVSLDAIGIHFNFYEAVQIFLCHAFQADSYRECYTRYIALTIEKGHQLISARLTSIRKFGQLQHLTKPERLSMVRTRVDHDEIESAMKMMINANILRTLHYTGCVKEEDFLESWGFEDKEKIYYDYRLEISSWIEEFGRSFFKIVGYYSTIEDYNIFLPGFLLDKTCLT